MCAWKREAVGACEILIVVNLALLQVSILSQYSAVLPRTSDQENGKGIE